jgi:O-antigen ligase
MQKILQSSVVYRILVAIGSWFGSQWANSYAVGRYLRTGRGESSSRESVFTRAFNATHAGVCTVFEKLRLDRLLRGSVFTMPHVWCFLTVALSPIIPTMAALALALVTFLSLILSFSTNREKKLTYAPVNRFIILYALTYLVSIFTSVTVSGSLKGGLLQAVFILFAIVAQNSVSTRRQLDATLAALVVSGGAVALYGLYQYVVGATGASAWIDAKMFDSISTRVYSTLENPNVLSEYLLLVIPFSFALCVAAKSVLSRLLYLGCFGVMALCMVLTFSRGGWLGLIVAAAIFLVMLDRRFIIVGIIGLIALYFLLPDAIVSRFTSIGNLGDSSTSYRLSIWLGTIAMLSDYWFAGIGPGTAAFNKIYPIYSFNAAAAQHSHNLFLQVMCDAGICGLALFLIILWSHLRHLASSLSRETDRKTRLLLIAAISSMCGFLTQSMTDHSFYNYRVTLLFWAVLGLSAVTARRGSMTAAHTEVDE